MAVIKQLTQSDIAPYREAILKKQDGLCLICKKPPIRPCLDHHHKKKIRGTGKIRGVLCSNCNVFLSRSENAALRYAISHNDLPTVLRAMADYLEKPQYPYLHPSEKAKPKRFMKSSYNELKAKGGKKIPPYPKSGGLIKALDVWFKVYNIVPRFYK